MFSLFNIIPPQKGILIIMMILIIKIIIMIIIITKQKIKKLKKKSKHYPLKLKQIAVPNLRDEGYV